MLGDFEVQTFIIHRSVQSYSLIHHHQFPMPAVGSKWVQTNGILLHGDLLNNSSSAAGDFCLSCISLSALFINRLCLLLLSSLSPGSGPKWLKVTNYDHSVPGRYLILATFFMKR